MIKWKEQQCYLGLISAVIGSVIFIAIYGVQVLNVTYIDWLLPDFSNPKLIMKGDLYQHFIGWEAFRNSAWHFPIGMMDNVIYPDMVSVMYTDSIPLFAVIFKVIAPLLPDSFQYFGLWGIFSYAMQSVMAAFIIKRLTQNNLVCLMASLFFTLSAVVMQRMFIQTSLAGHWVILAAILLLVYRSSLSWQQRLCWWGMLGALAVMVHAYFVPLNFMLLLCIEGAAVYYERKWVDFGAAVGGYAAGAVVSLWLMGAFGMESVRTMEAVGSLGSNLNTFFSPMEWSVLLPAQAGVSYARQWVGFAYLGAGMLLLTGCAVLMAIIRYRLISEWYPRIRHYIWGGCLTILVCAAVAFGPNVYFGNEVLFTFQYPKSTEQLLTTFRYTGRFAWIIMYIIMLTALAVIIKALSARYTVVLLGCALAVQLADFSGAVASIHKEYTSTVNFKKPLFYDKMPVGDIKHIVIMPNISMAPNNDLYRLAHFAMRHKMTMNDFYLARKSAGQVEGNNKKQIMDIYNDEFSDDRLLFINDKSFLLGYNSNLKFYFIGEYVFAGNGEWRELQEYLTDISDYKFNLLEDSTCEVQNGSKQQNEVILEHSGILFGQYLTLRPGRYQVKLTGTALNEAEYDVCYETGQKLIPCSIVSRNNNSVIYQFMLTEPIKGIELRVRNGSDKTVRISQMLLENN